MNKLIISIIISMLYVSSTLAQTGDAINEPGYFDFGDLSSLETSAGVTEVVLEEGLLSILASIGDTEDTDIISILDGVQLIMAQIFNVDESNQGDIKDKISSIDSKLSNTEWKRIMRTRSDEEMANVYIRLNNDKKIIGLVVTHFEKDGEAAFVNIVGTIDLANLGKFGKKFNIPHLEGVGKHNGDSDED